MVTGVLFITICFPAYANGANDNFASIALSWLLTLPCAALCSAAIYAVGSGF